MKKIIFCSLLWISTSVIASNELAPLFKFSANSVICKKIFKDHFSEEFSKCSENYMETNFTFTGAIQTYPGMPLYSFVKTVIASGKSQNCMGEVILSFYESLEWVDGLGYKRNVGDGVTFSVTKIDCR